MPGIAGMLFVPILHEEMDAKENTVYVPQAQSPSVEGANSLITKKQRMILKPWCMPTPNVVQPSRMGI